METQGNNGKEDKISLILFIIGAVAVLLTFITLIIGCLLTPMYLVSFMVGIVAAIILLTNFRKHKISESVGAKRFAILSMLCCIPNGFFMAFSCGCCLCEICLMLFVCAALVIIPISFFLIFGLGSTFLFVKK